MSPFWLLLLLLLIPAFGLGVSRGIQIGHSKTDRLEHEAEMKALQLEEDQTEHRHHWRVTSANRIHLWDRGSSQKYPRVCTDVSKICTGCGEPTFERINGIWQP